MVSTIFLQLSKLKLSSSKYMLDQLECMMACRIISWSIIACHVFTLTKSQIHYTARSKVSFINVFFSAVLLICSRIFIHKIFFLHQIAVIVILQIQLERDTWDTDRKIQTLTLLACCLTLWIQSGAFLCGVYVFPLLVRALSGFLLQFKVMHGVRLTGQRCECESEWFPVSVLAQQQTGNLSSVCPSHPPTAAEMSPSGPLWPWNG